MNTEETIASLFKAASSLGYRQQIELLGDEAIVAFEGWDTGDYRLSDSEHVIHELTHCATAGIDPGSETAMRDWTRAHVRMSEEDRYLNEIETFSVTMEVLRRFKIEFEEGSFLDALDIQLHGFDPPEGFITLEHVRTFHETNRGKIAVEKIIQLLKAEGA